MQLLLKVRLDLHLSDIVFTIELHQLVILAALGCAVPALEILGYPVVS